MFTCCYLARTYTQKPLAEDGLPQQICLDCYKKCQQWEIFRKTCQANEDKLKKEKPQDVPETKAKIEKDQSKEADVEKDDSDDDFFWDDDDDDDSVDVKESFPEYNLDVIIGEGNTQRKPQKRNHQCKKCGKAFHSNWKLERHLPTHDREKPPTDPNRKKDIPRQKYECVHCGKWLPTNWKLQRHLNGHAKAEHRRMMQYEAKIAKGKEAAKALAARPLYKADPLTVKQGTSTQKSNPDVLPTTFIDPDAVDDVDEAMDDDEEGEVRSDTKLLYKCGQCGKAFKTPSKLTRHIKTHGTSLTVKSPYHCSLCKVKAMDGDELKKHMACHRV